LPDRQVRRALRQANRRLRLEASLDAVVLGSAAAGAAFAFGTAPALALAIAIAAGVVSAARSWRRLTDARLAQLIEAGHPALQNLLITAQEALAGRALHPVVSREVFEQAADRLRGVDNAIWTRGSVRRAQIAVASAAAVGLLMVQGSTRGTLFDIAVSGPDAAGQVEPSAPALRVTVVPPAYTRRSAVTTENPVQVEAIEGSIIRLHVPVENAMVQLVEAGREPRAFRSVSDGAVLELTAAASSVFLIRQLGGDPQRGRERLLQLQVQRDARPVVTIEQPGRDLLFGSSNGSVPIVIAARDDLNVASVSLRYTRVAGSGETFTFEEGEVPLRITAGTPRTSRGATGTLVLARLKLEDGDTLVYRALARDDKPGADEVSSESYLIEIGRRTEAASTGFSLPEERDRQGLSQQMLIVKTERLQAQRSQLPSDAVLEQSQLLAAEQRAIRAEFVFMTGGEVVDEVEEAEHSHELAAGRFENAGQVELLNAIREMSRAEARLNAGDTTGALRFERAALRALQRAFDRRRYFLRTLPERARIDRSRRFAGDSSGAKPAVADRRDPMADPAVQAMRETIRALSAAIERQSDLDASLAARVIAIDPGASSLQQVAVRLSSSESLTERTRAAVEARAAVTVLLRRRLGPAAVGEPAVDPLKGFLTSGVPR
jgi:hypothetical protein